MVGAEAVGTEAQDSGHGGPMVGTEALWWARRPGGGHGGPVVGTAAVMGMVGTEAVLVGAKALS